MLKLENRFHPIVVFILERFKYDMMKSINLKKILLTTGGVFLLLVAVLCVHIYMVTRPKAPDAHTIVMARVDINKPLTNDEAEKITTWFYQQNGVEHVLCNADMHNIVFTYYPVKADGNEIVSRFKSDMNYGNAIRYIPTEKDMQGGCPVATTSYSYKLYSFISKTL